MMQHVWKRLLSSKIEPALQSASKWVEQLDIRKVPVNLFAVRFDRASGPGGQNVNKVNSKCTLMLYNFSTCSWLPQEVRSQILQKSRYYARSSDSIVIQASESRSRESNKKLALEKFVNHIKEICWFPKPTEDTTIAKWDQIKRSSHEKRLNNKKMHSDKKKLRKSKDFF
ncbi:hypothetical protein ZYGR_0I00940 [Zygosaccharomyces rouxii]|uniref:Prokaryotic-type class I peptide chain release factors domain-containing protein n=1 Tax=Zygosaccharomyces rouxii TaxID=4956 RepID=A0A1Q2ZWV3_ZYGRO|nr:hypothetical protein ZYGR_0I00940 [Zygosaccharomyces rouxii]